METGPNAKTDRESCRIVGDARDPAGLGKDDGYYSYARDVYLRLEEGANATMIVRYLDIYYLERIGLQPNRERSGKADDMNFNLKKRLV